MRGKFWLLLALLGALATVGGADESQEEEAEPRMGEGNAEEEPMEDEEEEEEEEDEEEEEEEEGDMTGDAVVRGPGEEEEEGSEEEEASPGGQNPPVMKPMSDALAQEVQSDAIPPVQRGARCQETAKCKDALGTCQEWCKDWEREIPYGCDGYGCKKKCCAPEKQLGCTRLPECIWKGGECKDKCLGREKELNNGCMGKDCWCCYLKHCTPEPKCKKEEGVCKEWCEKGEWEIKGGCWGKGCTCCVKEKKCETLGKCSMRKGVCKDKCNAWEKEEKWGCAGGKDCKCCYKEEACRIQNKCLTKGGECKNECDYKTEKFVKDGCKLTRSGGTGGTNCKCCVPKRCIANRKCWKYEGTCKKWCEGKEFEVKGGCYGHKSKKCKCCSTFRGCNPTRKCTKHDGWCENRKCNEKDEIEIPWGCIGKNCHCCAPAYKASAIAQEANDPDYAEYAIYDTDYYDGPAV